MSRLETAAEQNEGLAQHLCETHDACNGRMAQLDVLTAAWAASTDSVDAALVSTVRMNEAVAETRSALDSHLGAEFGKARVALQQWNQSSVAVERGAETVPLTLNS